MAGTKSGGIQAATTNKERHGDDFYKRIGAKGGKLGHTGGFAANRELARAVGAIGGRISRRSNYTGPKTIGLVEYFRLHSSDMNDVPLEDFIGLCQLGVTQRELTEVLGRSATTVQTLIKQAKKENLL